MNTAEDIKRMLGELVDEAIRIGGAEGENTLGTEPALKEQVQRLTDDKRKLTQNLDHVIEENNDLGLTIGRLKATLEKTWDENETLQAKVDSYDGVSREQAKEVDRLKAQVHRYEEQLNMLHEMMQKLEAEHKETTEKLEKAQQENACLNAECDLLDKTAGDLRKKLEDAEAKIEKLNEALAIYRVPTPRACPFCGGPAEVHQLHKDEWYVVCPNEDCPVNPETNTFDSEAEAIEAWNNSYNAPKVTCDWR